MIFLRRFSKIKSSKDSSSGTSSATRSNSVDMRVKNNSYDSLTSNKISLQLLLHSFHYEVNDPSTESSPSREKIKKYYSIETLLELQDQQALDLLRDYLRQRQNEEYLTFLELRREFQMRQQVCHKRSCSRDRSIEYDDDFDSFMLIDTNSITSKANDWLLFDEIQTIYNKFLNLESAHCMNVPSQIRDQIQKVLNEITRLDTVQRPRLSITSSSSTCSSRSLASPLSPTSTCSAVSRTFRASVGSEYNSCNDWHTSVDVKDLRERVRNCLNTLNTIVILQYNNEIMPHFTKTEEFKTLIIGKLIEYSSQESWDENTLIEHVLKQNDLSEYVKSFSKMKLFRMEQIRQFSTSDLKEKIGVKKLGHLKRLERLINDYNSSLK
ncbi:hypothetical protein C9374_012620 [Naegleria lovaniensis]|uniref:SAM domain-containing protein n=1 Tax=Naegleria lovaniensis TaxID=51637 RepID=A0AA88H047_NAELO|nr:uncharacterized protein C9374_012620 [Naegleria lovaniensis]KAG2392368.1 hypothetical protein C9374_012620 [Naegleria lovaniensis]